MSDALALQIAEKLLASEGTGGAWGIEIEEARIGYARIRMTVRADMTNGHGTLHGGMIFALADSAFAYACNSRNATTVAQSASILFLSPGQVGEVLIAEASEEAQAGRSGAYSVSVRSRDGRPVAQFQGHSRTVGGPIIDDKDQGASHG